MFKGGGTAGGSASKTSLTVIKHVPKFLEQVKMQFIKKEAKLEDKVFATFNQQLPEDKNAEYDFENAVVLDAAGEEIDDADKLIGKDTKSGNKKSKPIIKDKNNVANEENEDTKIDTEKVDIHLFKPKFVSKNKKTSINIGESRESGKKKLEEDTKSKTLHKNDPIKEENEPGKRSLDTYVKTFIGRDPNEPEIKKKVKTNPLLSFDDE